MSLDDTLRVVHPTFYYPPGLLHERHHRYLSKAVDPVMQTLFEDGPPEAVLSYWADPDGTAALRIAKTLGVPHAVIVGGSDVLIVPRHPRRLPGIRNVLTRSDAVITVSEGLRAPVIKLGADEDRVRMIEQGINDRHFHQGDQAAAREAVGVPQSTALLLWVGRMVSVKRLDVLLAAVSRLHRRGKRFQLCLIGDGPLRKSLERRVEGMAMQGTVRFVGPVEPDRLGNWYRAADVTLLSSESEGLPNVLRESLGCGTPFVATDVGSIREIADPAWSELVPVGDDARFADAIETVLSGEHRVAAECYRPPSWQAMAEEVAALLQSLRSREQHQSASAASHQTGVCLHV